MMRFRRSFKYVIVVVVVVVVFLLMSCSNGEEEGSDEAAMEKTEREALYSTIQGFVGKWWNGSDLYPDPCGWTPIQGVSCDMFDGFWYVTDLTIGPIHDNSLACAPNVGFSPHLFGLNHLKSLSFFSCFLSPHRRPVAIPTQNWELLSESLESLEFRSNPGLTGNIPNNFGSLKRLQSLVLLENGLTGEIPTDIGNLVNLRRLVLAGNSFKGGIPFNLGALKELLILDLSRNSLNGPLPLTFGGLTSLLKLDLSNNQLEGEIPNQIGQLKNLTLLDLSGNRLSGGLTKSLQGMNSLEQLVLSNNPLLGGDLLGVQWGDLQGLVSLDLSNVGLTGGVPESMAGLKRLRFLGLNDNRLTGYISPKLADLPNVSALYLNGNNLTGELKFSELFYGKMGRRFGAWDNPNLCYPNGLVSRGCVPFGVKPCQQEQVTLFGVHSGKKYSNLGDGNNLEGNSQLMMASLGISSFCVAWFWCIILGQMMVFLLLNIAL